MALKNTTGDILILEDDIKILDNFQESLDMYYQNLPKDWDVFSLAWDKRTKYNSGIKVAKGILKPFDICTHEHRGEIFGLHSIIYRRRCLQLIRDKIFPIKLQIEKYLDLLKNTCLINLYVCEET